MALAIWPVRQGQQRSRVRIFQALSWAFALSPGARSFAWERLASFWDSGLFLPLYGVSACAAPWPQSFRQHEVRVLIVLESVFRLHVRLFLGRVVDGAPGVPGCAPAPTAPGGPPSWVEGRFGLVRWVLAVCGAAASRRETPPSRASRG